MVSKPETLKLGYLFFFCMGGINRHKYSWEDLNSDMRMIFAWIAKQKDVENVHGIPRGGLVPALYLSNHLEIGMVDRDKISEKTLVVDDIADTGKTLSRLIDSLGFRPKIATLYCHPKTIIEPDYFVREKPGEEPGGKTDWVIFPWEKPTDYMRDSDK